MTRKRICQLLLICLVFAAFSGFAFAQEKVKLTFWHWWGVQREPLMEKIIADFEAAYPWIEVEQIVQPWDRRSEKVFTALAGGNPPDVIMVQRYEVPQLVSQNLIIPIDDWIEKYDVDLDMFYPSEIGSFIIDGKVWTMPMPTGGATTFILIYNRDIFAELGLPDRAPETWGELWDWSKKATKLNANGYLEKIGINMHSTDLFLPLLYSNNGHYMTDDMRTITFNSPEGLEVLEFMTRHTVEINGGPENVASFYMNTSGEAAGAPFYVGIEAMAWHNVSVFFHIKNLAPHLNYGVGIMPYNEKNPKASGHGIVEQGWGYVIPTAVPEHKREAAYLFIDWITTKEQAAGWFMFEQMRPSPVKAFNENPAYRDINPNWNMVLKALETDVSIPISPVHLEIKNIIGQMIEMAAYGQATPKEALEWAAEEAQMTLDDYWFFR